jgi:uncharacterized membrane protein YhiD involved in acid resistance
VVGLRHYVLGAGITLIVFVVLELVRKVEQLAGQKPATSGRR